MRAAAQMISYEVPMGLALIVILLVAGSLRPEVIVDQQAESGVWNAFMHPLAFFLIVVVAFAETNRTPFDLAECEQELVGGFHTEYSSMKFAMFFLGEYAHMVTGSALIVALFLGGWHFWGLPGVENNAWWAALIKFCVFWAKIIAFIGFYMMIRWTIPRFRFDQLMKLAWKGMIPMGMGLVVATGVLTALGWQDKFLPSIVSDAIVLAITLWLASRSKAPVTGRQDNLPEIEVRPQAG
jgi:NADH-quinone oxidoreductase subunit H